VTGQRAIGGQQYDVVQMQLKERDGLIGALAASAPNVLVVEPTDLRLRVIEHLQEVSRG
jgi:predicted DNA-binding transcriptional regulator YafY